MKKLFLIFIFFISCSSTPQPSWQVESFNQLEYFKNSKLKGKNSLAEIYFKKAVDEILSTGKLEPLDKAYLFKCAILQASFSTQSCKKPLLKKNNDYFNFILGSNDFDSSNLPKKYQTFANLLKNNSKIKNLNKEIKNIENNISKIIAVTILIKQKKYNLNTINLGLKTAQNQGWKPTVFKLLQLKKEILISTNPQKAKELENQINILKSIKNSLKKSNS